MGSYIGRHAELYDIFYRDKPYDEEALFVHRCLQQQAIGPTERVLELACGTGTHALALERLGYEVTAVDYSAAMLGVAKQKIASAGSRVNTLLQDISTLNLAGATFDAAVCLFDSIGYVATNERLRQVFEGVHSHLRPDGLFVFEFWHAAAMLSSYDPLRIRRWQVPGGSILRISSTELDCEKQLSRVTYGIYELREDGTYSHLEETQVNRFFLVQEMAHWLTSSGFTPLKWYAGFSDDEKITTETWHVIAVARRNSDAGQADGKAAQ